MKPSARGSSMLLSNVKVRSHFVTRVTISFASSKNCQHEIIKHQRLPIFGTQFHPEMSKDGQLLIKSFLKIIHWNMQLIVTKKW